MNDYKKPLDTQELLSILVDALDTQNRLMKENNELARENNELIRENNELTRENNALKTAELNENKGKAFA